LQGFQPDLIHTHEPLEIGLLGIVHGQKAGIPILLTAHLMPWCLTFYLPNIPVIHNFVSETVWKYARWLLRKFDQVLCPTEITGQEIMNKTGIAPVTIPNGIDLQYFRPDSSAENRRRVRQAYHIPEEAKVILHAGRLDPEKCVDRAIKAAAKIIRESNTHLLIVGDGREKSALLKLCESLGIGNRTHFAGFVMEKNELKKIYQAADVFIFASEVETQGIVLIEAAACGLPIVAVNARSVPEIVHDGVNGFLAEPRDIQSFGDSITTLLQNPRLAKEMGTASRKIAKCHNIQDSMEAHQELYLRLVRQKHAEPVKRRSFLRHRQAG
jgi:glycosyltransferase involved in cell wall biosynthesis